MNDYTTTRSEESNYIDKKISKDVFSLGFLSYETIPHNMTNSSNLRLEFSPETNLVIIMNNEQGWIANLNLDTVNYT